MKVIFFFLIICATTAQGQSADYLILKKHNKKIQMIFSGEDIDFINNRGNYVHGNINRIEHDTLFLQEFIVQRLPTTLGTYILDTAGSYHYKYNYREIAALGKAAKKNFNLRGSGAALMGGGALLALGSGIVYLADPKKFSAPLLIGALSLGVVGYFLSRGSSSSMPIGKKYQLQYMDMHDVKK